MRRSSPWLFVVIVLVGVLIVREPRLRRIDDVFLSCFLQNSGQRLPPAEVTVVEVGSEDFRQMTPRQGNKPLAKGEAARPSLSPLEYALFVQAALVFQPAVIAFEPVVAWHARDKAQEQVFIDQAMKVPKLLVAVQLADKGERDIPVDDVPSFSQVSGPRGDLAGFSGVRDRPDDDTLWIATPGFTNPSTDRSDRIRTPLLFEYRGGIVPSFTLQAILLWLRCTTADVKVELGKQILLPNGWKIPIHRDGTFTINPAAAQSVHRLALSDLLLAAQEHDAHRPPTVDLTRLKNEIVLFRIAGDPLQPPNVFATAIATIQSNACVRRVPWFYEWCVIGILALSALFLWRLPRGISLLCAIALSAGYALLALDLLSQSRLWLPVFLPFALLWILVVVRLAEPKRVNE
jgi:CHASE2 domain-containing protein